MTIYYVAQEPAFAPGISGNWPDTISLPASKHGRLKKLSDDICLLIDETIKEQEIIESGARQPGPSL